MDLRPATRIALDAVLRVDGRFVGEAKEDEAVDRIRSIATCGEPFAAAFLAQATVAPRERIARAAADAVAVLLRDVEPLRLPDLDRSARARFGPTWKIGASDVDRFQRFGPSATACVCAASLHPDGRVRETAVARLEDLGSEIGVGFLLLRIGDWADPVMSAALEALRSCLRPSLAGAFARCAALVVHRERIGRRALSGVAQAVADLLLRAECADSLARSLETSDRRRRRALVALLGDRLAASDVAALLRDSDAGLHIHVLRNVAPRLSRDRRLEILRDALADPTPFVRVEALERLAREEPPVADRPQLLEDALFDASASVRERARWWLGETRVNEIAARYRNAVAEGTVGRLAVALAGLGETGTRQDSALARSRLDDPQPRTRAAALTAWSRLDLDTCKPRLLDFVADPSPRVSRAARDVHLRDRVRPDPEALDRLLAATSTHTVRNARALFGLLSPWDRLSRLLDVVLGSDEGAREWALDRLRLLRARLNSLPSRASPGAWSRAGRGVAAAAEFLGENETREWEFVLGRTRPG